MIPPNPLPLQYEPRSELIGAGASQFGLQGFRADPAPGQNLVPIGADRIAATAYEHRAQLLLRARRIELRTILEFEQEMQRTTQAKLLLQTAVDRRLHSLGPTRMAAATVRPVQRPEPLGRRALLQQQLAVSIEDQQRKGAMQNAVTTMTLSLAQVADFAVGFIHQDEQFGLWRDVVRAAETVPNFVHHKRNSTLPH